ncbi:MAG: hypothetical protein VZR11_05075 [Succinimonas sp.]|nr:hypothetical protein [Succinimonas sp.]
MIAVTIPEAEAGLLQLLETKKEEVIIVTRKADPLSKLPSFLNPQDPNVSARLRANSPLRAILMPPAKK